MFNVSEPQADVLSTLNPAVGNMFNALPHFMLNPEPDSLVSSIISAYVLPEETFTGGQNGVVLQFVALADNPNGRDGL